MRLLFLSPPPSSSLSPLPSVSIKLDELALWFHSHLATTPKNLIQELTQARILLLGSNNEITLHSGFQESLKYNLTGIHEPWSTTSDTAAATVAASMGSDGKIKLKLHNVRGGPTEHELHHECIQKWNNILQFMITCDYSLKISDTVINYLLEAQLMQKVVPMSTSFNQNHSNELVIRISAPSASVEGSGENHHPKKLCITSKGYEYLLLDIQTQVLSSTFCPHLHLIFDICRSGTSLMNASRSQGVIRLKS